MKKEAHLNAGLIIKHVMIYFCYSCNYLFNKMFLKMFVVVLSCMGMEKIKTNTHTHTHFDF